MCNKVVPHSREHAIGSSTIHIPLSTFIAQSTKFATTRPNMPTLHHHGVSVGLGNFEQGEV
jgi:hypothetical protein